MATISRFRAIAAVGPIRLSGLMGWLAWPFVQLLFLAGFDNRLAAVANWAIADLGSDRRQRTITEQQVLAHTSLQELAPASTREATAP